MDKRIAGSQKEPQRWTTGDKLQGMQQLFTAPGFKRFKKASCSGKASDNG